MKYSLGFILVGLVVVGMGWVWASEKKELQIRVAAEREVAARAEREERRNLEERERAQNARRHREQDQIRETLEDLHHNREKLLAKFGEDHPQVQTVQRQIQTLERELEKHHEHHGTGHRNELAEKIEHLHAAAEHLDQAGVPDLARQLHERAEAMERQFHRHHAEQGSDHRLDEVLEMVKDLKQEVEKLRDEVAELRKERREVER